MSLHCESLIFILIFLSLFFKADYFPFFKTIYYIILKTPYRYASRRAGLKFLFFSSFERFLLRKMFRNWRMKIDLQKKKKSPSKFFLAFSAVGGRKLFSGRINIDTSVGKRRPQNKPFCGQGVRKILRPRSLIFFSRNLRNYLDMVTIRTSNCRIIHFKRFKEKCLSKKIDPSNQSECREKSYFLSACFDFMRMHQNDKNKIYEKYHSK